MSAQVTILPRLLTAADWASMEEQTWDVAVDELHENGATPLYTRLCSRAFEYGVKARQMAALEATVAAANDEVAA